MNVLLLYYSGVGCTKNIAHRIHQELIGTFNLEIYSIEDIPITIDFETYDSLIIGYPVFHVQPPERVLDFIAAIPPLQKPVPVFIFNTRAMFSANAQRILAQHLAKKNFKVILDREYRGPASDGTLLTPSIKRFWKFEKNLDEKIHADCQEYIQRLQNQQTNGYIPRFRLYSILNAPNKLAGQLMTMPIYLNKESCTQCGLCARRCPAQAQVMGANGFPEFKKELCEDCLRCIHHCPKHALSLRKKKFPEKTLSREYK